MLLNDVKWQTFPDQATIYNTLSISVVTGDGQRAQWRQCYAALLLSVRPRAAVATL